MSPPQETLGAEIEHAVLTLAGALLIGFLIGAVALRYLQREGLHWSWGMLGAPFAYLLWFLDWRMGLICTAATLTTMRRGAREHAEVLYHGGEEARLFREAPGPVRFAWGQVKARRYEGQRLKAGRLALGTRRGGGRCRVPFGNAHGVHGLVLGATGYGKTVTQAAIAEAYVAAGQPVIAIDPKGDGALRETLRQAAEESGAHLPRVVAPTAHRFTTRSPAATRPRSPTRPSPRTDGPSPTTSSPPSACSGWYSTL